MQTGVEKAGKNIREAGELQKHEEKPQSESAYGVGKTEAAAKSAADNAYAMGRKLALRQRKAKKIQDWTIASKPEQPNENIPKKQKCDKATSASYTVSVGVNLPENAAHCAENRDITTAEIKLKTKPEEPLAGSFIKIEAAVERIKEKPNSHILEAADTKTVWERPIHRVKPYVGVSAENSVETASLPKLPKIKELSNGDIKIKTVAINKAAAANEANTNTEPLTGTPAGGSAVYAENTAKNNIKTKESQVVVENANSDKITKIAREQGRKLAIKNLSGKKVQQQFDYVNAEEQSVEFGNMSAAELSSVWEQPISDVTDVKSFNNPLGFEANSFKQLVGQQQKMVNIKTREYEKSRKTVANSVRESNLGRQKLFGKSIIYDVKSALGNKDKSAVKAGFAGIKEKSEAEKSYSSMPNAGNFTSYKAVKYNAFGYFDANNIRTRNKDIKQFVGCLIPKNAKEMLAAIMGMGTVIAVVIIICLIASLFASPFGIFFSGADTMSDAVNELNADFAQRIEEIKAGNTYDELAMSNAGSSAMAANWPNVLAVYSVLTTMNDSNPYEAVTLDAVKKARLREVFWAMNPISYEVRTVYDAEIEVLYITVAEKDCWQLADEYGFTPEQRQMLAELKKSEYREMFMALAGSYRDIALTPEEIAEIIANLPEDLSEERRQVVLTAYQLEGKVNYFWGGKSLTLGWDSRWGTPQEVWAAGSVSTGTVRPFGLDCSGFVDWVFYNASDGSFIMGRGGGAASQHSYCRPISWSKAQPGDLVFYPDNSHVGIVCGFDRRGNIQIIHCAAGYNNVVVTGKAGFTDVGRPDYFSD